MNQKEKENFYRTCTVIVDHSKDSLTELIECDLANKSLSFEQYINLHKHDIYHLCNNSRRCCQCTAAYILPRHRVLHLSQLELLLDKYGPKLTCHGAGKKTDFCCCSAKSGVKVDILDITLARCLLVHFSLEVFWYGCVTRTGISFGDFLNTNKHNIYHLMKVNTPCCQCPARFKFPVPSSTISQQQWESLWDRISGSCVSHIPKQYDICSVKAKSGIDVQHLDSSLSGKLLENLCPTRKAVEDLVYIRNHVYGHASTGSLTDADYKIYMSKTEKALLQIATVCSRVKETTDKLNDVRQRPLDETLLIRYQTLLVEQKRTDEEIKEVINMTKTQLVQRLDLMKMAQSGEMQEILSAVKDVAIYPDEKEIRKKKLQADAFASVKNHIEEGTFVEHAAVQVCIERLEKTGRVVISAPPGTGKSRIAMELLHRYSTSHNEYAVMHIFSLTDWQDIMHENDKCIVLCDDIFGITNFNHKEELHRKCIDFIAVLVQ